MFAQSLVWVHGAVGTKAVTVGFFDIEAMALGAAALTSAIPKAAIVRIFKLFIK